MTARVKPALKCTVINDVNLIKCNHYKTGYDGSC